MQKYQDLLSSHSADLAKLNRSFNLISRARLIVGLLAILSFYRWIRTENDLYPIVGVLLMVAFAILLRKHRKVSWTQRLKKTLVSINEDEIDFLEKGNHHNSDGAEYIDHDHLYSYDLDIFGPNSLYHYINRCSTYIGKKKLADFLLTLLNKNEILANQAAIKELTPKVEWRQDIQSLGRIVEDNQENYDTLVLWTKKKMSAIHPVVNVLSYAMPALLVGLTAYASIFQNLIVTYLAIFVFLFNLIILVTQSKLIKNELLGSEKVSEIFKKYGLIIQSIEEQSFSSPKLKALQNGLNSKNVKTSTQLEKLASYFSDLQSIENGFGAALFNGTLLYHIHALRKLLVWKKENAKHILNWLDIIGEIETLNSVANMAYNNPDFSYPSINEEQTIAMTSAGHPLLKQKTRINNDVNFKEHPFIILTGSNMSGKSTFLRTLGINMVLAGAGSPICAAEANIHPLPVIVSMRQTDSLVDGESYFFAEIKRLQQLFQKFQGETCFVLLDEILKGTNSDDKRSGTLATIRNVISAKAYGALATHDLEVCKITDEHPESLSNKCFEVEIKDNDLYFDYKLRDGICQNQSATFLMEKLGLI